jgi:hypothetical protein
MRRAAKAGAERGLHLRPDARRIAEKRDDRLQQGERILDERSERAPEQVAQRRLRDRIGDVERRRNFVERNFVEPDWKAGIGGVRDRSRPSSVLRGFRL